MGRQRVDGAVADGRDGALNDWGISVLRDGRLAFGVGHRRYELGTPGWAPSHEASGSCRRSLRGVCACVAVLRARRWLAESRHTKSSSSRANHRRARDTNHRSPTLV